MIHFFPSLNWHCHQDKQTAIHANTRLYNQTLETSEGGIYYLNQMGTGQTQAAYLKSLLSTEDDRQLIAMFDEVGMMDDETLSQIINEMERLYNENRLFLGLIVQKANQAEVVNLEGK